MNPFLQLILTLIWLIELVIFAWVILGLLNYFNLINRFHPFVRKVEDILNRLTGPLLKPIQKVVPSIGGLDLSPLILLLLLQFLKNALIYYS